MLIKYYVIKHLILLKIYNMVDVNTKSLQWSITFLIKNTSGGTVKNKIISNKELAEALYKSIIRPFNEKITLIFYRKNLRYRLRRYAIDK